MYDAIAPTSRNSRVLQHPAMRRFALAFAALAVIVASMLGSQIKAEAATANCANGRCWVFLSNAETRALGQGKAPALPAAVPWQLRTAYWALVQGHRYIAKSYADRGLCSAFLLSSRPWENQGFVARRC